MAADDDFEIHHIKYLAKQREKVKDALQAATPAKFPTSSTTAVDRLGVKPRGLSVDSRSIRVTRKAGSGRSRSASLS